MSFGMFSKSFLAALIASYMLETKIAMTFFNIKCILGPLVALEHTFGEKYHAWNLENWAAFGEQ